MTFSDHRLNSRRRSLILLIFVILMGVTATLVNAVSWSDYEMRLTTCSEFDGLPDIVQTSDGAIWVFWSRNEAENYNIFYTISFDEGTSWSPETRLTANSGANTGVSVLQALDGSIWVVWSSDRTGNYEIFYKTSPDFG
ncbi:exo-alpha-sialidase, partial [Candidatus Bathyarchaeota archaeon]|nr:exo-alpha-sialidase [Candidatus Bathyarchaeota archaeon]